MHLSGKISRVEKPAGRYKWYILALAMLTDILTVAMPGMAMAVLAKQIANDLQLNLVQVGVIWGIGSLPTIITGLLGGILGDRFGSRYVLALSALCAGLLGAARGLAGGFIPLLILTLLGGSLSPFITMNAVKVAGQWFPRKQLGLANGALGGGMAFGFLLGTLLSDAVLSPWLGGWRNVLIAYGLVGALTGLPWLFVRQAPGDEVNQGSPASIRSNVRHVAGLKIVWQLGLVMFGVTGAIQGILGYLPLYLRNLGWAPLQADQTVSMFHIASLVLVLPITIWSDRLGSRKLLLVVATLLIVIGSGLLGFASGGLILAAVLVTGCVRDSFMSLAFALLLDEERVTSALSGTALGMLVGISNIGSFIAPPLGNSLAKMTPAAPFLFWCSLALSGLILLLQIKPAARPMVEIPLNQEVS